MVSGAGSGMAGMAAVATPIQNVVPYGDAMPIKIH